MRRIAPLLLWNGACTLLYVVLMAYAMWLGVTQPYKNFDIVFYTSAVTAWSQPDAVLLHNEMIEGLRPVVELRMIKEILAGKLASTPDVLVEQLPFYTTKPLYLGLMWAMQHSGLASLPESTWLISVIAFALLAVLLASWCPTGVNRGVWLLVILMMTWCGLWPMRILAHYSTPDALSMLLAIGALYALIVHQRWWLFLILAALSILTRPELLLLWVIVLTIFAIFAGTEICVTLKRQLIGIVLLCGVYIIVQYLTGAYGFRVLFHYAFIERVAHPAQLSPDFTFEQYWQILVDNIGHIAYDARLIPVTLISLIGIFFYWLRPTAPRKWLALLIAAWSYYALRFCLHPNWWEVRYYYLNHLLALYAAMAMGAPYVQLMWQRLKAHRARVNAL